MTIDQALRVGRILETAANSQKCEQKIEKKEFIDYLHEANMALKERENDERRD